MEWPGKGSDAECDFVTLDSEGGDRGRAGSGSTPTFGIDDTPTIEGPGEAPTTIKKTGVWETGGGS